MSIGHHVEIQHIAIKPHNDLFITVWHTKEGHTTQMQIEVDANGNATLWTDLDSQKLTIRDFKESTEAPTDG